MPAAAVIPAPIAYIKVVAVKKLVVECGVRALGVFSGAVSWQQCWGMVLDRCPPCPLFACRVTCE